MESIKVLIVEDEILIAEDLKDILISFGIKKIEMVHDKASALSAINDWLPDIVLLDVRMQGERDGIEIGNYISKHIQKPFVYITAHSDVAMITEIVKTKPAAYITKPIKKSDLFAAISLVKEQVVAAESKTIKIRDGYSTVVIDVSNIIYIESEGNYINIYCNERKYVSRQSLDSLAAELNTAQFFRIHRSYMVNISRVVRFSKKEVELEKGVLPLSRNVADEFEKRMLTKI